MHEKRRDHACPHCAAAFGEASSLTKHMRTQHTQNNKCPKCFESLAGVAAAATAATTRCNHHSCRACTEE